MKLQLYLYNFRGITQSGASLASWAFTDSSLKFVFRLGKYLGIDTLNVDEMVSRLKLEDPVDIVSASERIAFDELPIGDYFTFMPCVETEIPGEETFLSDHPENILRSGNFSRMPMMMGYNGREGLSFLEIQQSFPNMLSDLDATFEWMLPEVFLDKWRSPKEKRELVAKVKHFYFGNEKISNATVGEFVDYISDIIFR